MPYPQVGNQTVGMITDPDGRPLSSGRVMSGDGPGNAPPGQPSPGLRPGYPPAQWEAALRHVEGHVAAFMRRRGSPRNVVLVVSKEPCTPPRGCQAILPKILPADAQLTVYVAERGQPPRYFDTYHGNGRGVQQ